MNIFELLDFIQFQPKIINTEKNEILSKIGN